MLAGVDVSAPAALSAAELEQELNASLADMG
jgi:hypothetical protein